MKTYFGGVIILVITVIFSSCQKEVDGLILNQTQQDSTLSKIILLDTTRASGLDTFFKVNFIYDNQKRKIGEDFTEVDNSTGIRYTFFYRYSYKGTDTLPFKASQKYNFSTDSLISYLTYSNRFITKDSSVDFVSGGVSYIQVTYFSFLSGNRFLRKVINFDPLLGTSLLQDSTIYSRIVNAGNLISGVDSNWVNSGSPILNVVNSFQFAYDNKINPLTRLSVWYLGYYENFDDQIYIDMGVNNLISRRYDVLFPSSSSETNTFSYSYNNKGNPSIVRANGTDGNKGFYFYTKP